LRLSPRAEQLAEVRRALDDLGLSDVMLRDAKLLMSELVSNSIRHAGLGPDDTIQVTIEASGDAVRVTVRDTGTMPLPDHVVAGSIRPSPTGRSGWGLYLVDLLATRWGTSLGGRDGFWFELERPRGDDA
jgi:anti-sigma regulatory factor (Ser/Thr protein kinase)